jgi:hypothetical protein
MRAALLVAVVAACLPASADPGTFRVGISCAGTLPEFIVIESSGPGHLALRIEDAFAACVDALKDSHQWQGGS